MRAFLISSLLLAMACAPAPPITTPQSTKRRVEFQPPPFGGIPTPSDGRPGIFRTAVGLVIDPNGQVSNVLPIEGQEPFLSTTVNYGKKWRFSPGFPTTEGVPLSLVVTYQWGTTKSMSVDIKP
jgi:hypothetical protein